MLLLYTLSTSLSTIKGPYDELEQSLSGTSIHSSLEPNIRGHSLGTNQQTDENSKHHVKEKTELTSEMLRTKNRKVNKKNLKNLPFFMWYYD